MSVRISYAHTMPENGVNLTPFEKAVAIIELWAPCIATAGDENGFLKTAQCAVLPFEVSERIAPRER